MSSTVLAGLTDSKPSRKQRAANTVDKALRGGVLGAAVAALAWLLAVALGGTVLFLLVIATVLALLYTVVRGDKARMGIWGVIAIAWVLVLIERTVVNEHGGLWVAAASWLGVIVGARRAGIAKKSLILLLYPLISVAIVVAAGQDLLEPWGMSWLWVAAVLGPVIGARTVLNPSPRDHGRSKPAPKPDPFADL
jgi:hypothetical protein